MTLPITRAERRDLADESAADQWHAMYAEILQERQAKGLADSPIVICAEIDKRRRAARDDAD